MADFSIGGELDINISKALSAVGNVGRRIDETLLKIGKPITVDFDTKPAEKDLADLKVKAEEVGNSLSVDQSGKLAGGSSIIDGIGGSLAGLVSPVGLATAGLAALGAGLAATFEIGKEFETGLQAVSAVTGVTGSALEDIGDRAQGLAAQFGGSAKEQLEVFQTTLSKIGPQLAQDSGALTTFAENVNILSKTDSALGAAGAVDALTGAMLQFGVNVNDSNEVARESGRFINVLAASAAVGSASVSDVAGAIAVVGATAKNANVSFEETNAALQVLASKSLVGSQAGTALTAVVNKLQSASGPAAAQLKKMGTSSEELGKILTTQGIGPAMEKLKTGMNTLGSTSEKNAFLVSLFGETGVNAAAALLSGGEQLKEFTKGVTGTTAATDQAAINMATLEERISRGTAVLQNIAIDTYRVLAPILSSVIGTVSDAFGKVQSAIAPIFAKLTATFGELFTRIKPIFAAIAGFIGGAWLVQLTTVFAAVGTAVNVVITVFNKLFDGIVKAVSPVIDALKKAFGFTDDATKSIDVLEIFGNILSKITDTISFFGDILVEVGGFLVEFLITPLKIGFTVVAAIIEPIVNFGKSLFSAGETTKSTGDFFSNFINIVKQAPAFIKAVTEGFSAFVGSITDLITNFSFDKLTKVLKGETFSDAFTGSLDKTKLEEAKKRTLENFEKTFKELQVKRNLFENAKTDAEKIAEGDRYKGEIKRIENSIDAKKKAGEIDAKTAEALNQRLLDITKISEAKAAEENKKIAVAGEKGKQDSLKEEIAKAAEENRKLIGESDAAQIKDELERAIKANEEKFLASQRAVQKEIEETKKKKDVSEKERQTLLELLYEKENLVLENGLNQRDEIIAKYNQKQRDEQEKAAKDHAKAIQDRNDEVDKINAKLDEDERKRFQDLQDYRTKLDEDYAASHKSVFERIADETTSILASISDAIAGAFTVDDSAQKEATATAKKEYETQEKDLLASLKKRVISFDDYQSQIAAAQGKLNEAGASAGRSFGDAFTDGLNKAIGGISTTFEKIGNAVIGQYSKDTAELSAIDNDLKAEREAADKNAATDSVEKIRERKDRIAKLEIQQSKLQISTADTTATAIGGIVLGATAGLTAVLAEGTNVWTGLVLGTLDAMSAMIPMLTAMILGKEFVEKGVLGFVTAAVMTGALTALVAVARSAVSENGFSEGGDTRNFRKDEVAGVVHGEEFIVSAGGVKGEYTAFHKLHGILKSGESMGNILNVFENSKNLSNTYITPVGNLVTMPEVQVHTVNSVNNSAAVINELRTQTAVLQYELAEIRNSTDMIPTTFKGATKVNMNAKISLDKGLLMKELEYNNRRKGLQ